MRLARLSRRREPFVAIEHRPALGWDRHRRGLLTPDGKRFLITTPVTENRTAPLTVVLNWEAGLKK